MAEDKEQKGQGMDAIADADDDDLDAQEELSSMKKELDKREQTMKLKMDSQTRAFLGFFMILTILAVFSFQQIVVEREEAMALRTVSDTDLDGISDNKETELSGTNPFHEDTDNDGVSDIDEIYALTDPTSGANQPIAHLDYDSDGITNGDEIARGTDPLSHEDFDIASKKEQIPVIGGEVNNTEENKFDFFE
jgi:hypothetical protein